MQESNKSKFMSFGNLQKKLLSKGIIDEDSLESLINTAKQKKIPFITQIIKQEEVPSLDLALMLSEQFGIPFFDINALDEQFISKDLIDKKLIEKHSVLPLSKRGNKLFVLLSDPTKISSLEEIKFQTGLNIEPILAEYDKLGKHVSKYLSALEAASLGDLDESLEALDITSGEIEDADEDEDSDETPIVRFVNKVILEAINKDASDIHFEPYENNYRIRFRQDGILCEHSSPPINLAGRISTRLKVLAQLDISERRVPQDGRFRMKLSSTRSIDFRVSSCPTPFGEKIVMRILDPNQAKTDISELGLEAFQKDLLLKAIMQPQGMVIVTGPTGSGKTVTLYSALNLLNTIEKNISTCEDPVEINMHGINQVNVNLKAGVDFATALRSFLRQDPDIIMIGEIRDSETADIAVKASQTGHMVLSTLHTNNAPESLVRLINMGIPSYNLGSSISLVVAQRLARKLCDECKEAVNVPEEALKELGFSDEDLQQEFQVFKPIGCNSCVRGYRGRIGLFEMMPVSKKISKIIMENGDALAIENAALEEGMWTLRRSGINKVKLGLISLEELNRVVKS